MLTETTFLPLSIIVTSATDILCPFNVTGLMPVSADQMRQEPSAPAESTTMPDGKNRHLYTGPPWPFRSRTTSPASRKDVVYSWKTISS